MRIFVGIPISEDLGKKIEEWSSGFARDLRQKEKFRFIKPKNLHITLVPPFDVSPSPQPFPARGEGGKGEVPTLAEIIKKLKGVSRGVEPFKVRFDRVEFGPNKYQPRLIWASGEAPKGIQDLRLKIYEALGKKVDDRPYRLHCTLARFGKMQNVEFGMQNEIITSVDWKILVDHFVLYESKLFPQGAEYEILEEFKL